MVRSICCMSRSRDPRVHRDQDAWMNVDFYKQQKRVALRNCGVIDPENIDEYIAFDGYKALAKVLTEMTPRARSFRHDAGFRPARPRRRRIPHRPEVEVCAPATRRIRSMSPATPTRATPARSWTVRVLEGDPHAVIEAMAIAGYAIGANQGYIYVRAEYPIAVKRLQIAIDQAREYGLLGKNIFGTGFDFDLHIRLGAGAFVCGEETALMTLHRGQARRAASPSSVPGGEGPVRPSPPF